MNLPTIDLTESDLTKRWLNGDERDFLPAVLSCRERQLESALRELGNERSLRETADVALDQRDAAKEEIARLRELLAYAYVAPLGQGWEKPQDRTEDLARHQEFMNWRSEVGRTLSHSQAEEEAQALQRMLAKDADILQK